MKLKPIPSFIAFAIYSLLFVASVASTTVAILNMQATTRGVSYLAPEAPRTPTQFGVNADLDQYNDADLSRALGIIRDAKFTLVRQHFYWKDIEPRQGENNWDKWDRIITGMKQNGLNLVAVIDTTPVWARDLGEADLSNAAPENPEDYARFVASFAQHYPSIRYIQIWDNPNVHPFWGRRIADPSEYTKLLRAAAIAARAANPNVKIISAGLAPNAELIRGHADYSDVLFLRGMYDAGARDYFDIVGAKPYGMWSGPDDRRADKDVFNFSRAIVLRDEMVAHGDANKPIWAVEFGWNSLQTDWRGLSSPWGSDTDTVQSARLFGAVQRAKSEWNPWMPVLIAQTFQPKTPNDDPVWGFALVDKSFQPRALFAAMTRGIATNVAPATFDWGAFIGTLAALTIVAVISAWRGTKAALQISWNEYWRTVESRFTALPELAQSAILAFTVITFYASRYTILNFALLALIIFLFALRLDLGLAITVFTIPFYLQTKNLVGGAQFSLIELLILASVVAWAIRLGLRDELKAASVKLKAQSNWLDALRLSLSASDYAVIFFIVAGLVSICIAANFGVANREFRVIVLEPALLYALIRVSVLETERLKRLVDALILSALAISLLGLYQFFFTNYVIIGEGVRRILSVYGSPNNLALYLDRVLPMVIALIVFGTGRLEVAATTAQSLPSQTQPKPTKVGFAFLLPPHLHRTPTPLRFGGYSAFGAAQVFQSPRTLYTLAAIPIALCLYLTYSRAALLIGLPAGLAVVAIASGRRARIALGALFIVGIIAMLPLLQTERAQSLFQEGTGTGFFRVSVWQSAWEMGWQHPIFGVGLDNFLYEYPKYIKSDAWREPNLSHPHNIVLDFWTRMGIPGLIALGWMVVAFFRERVRATARVAPTRGIAIALMAGMVAAIAHGMIDAAYFFVDLAFVWMLMLGVMAKMADSK